MDEHIIITVSVDDMAVTANHISHIEQFKSQLQKYFKISDLGELSWLLGLKVTHNCSARTITLSQKAYVEMILEHFNLLDAKSATKPMDSNTMLTPEQSPNTHAELQVMDDVPYQRAIGSLMYMSTSTRPDIAFAVATISQFMRNPGKAHWEAAKCVLCYLKGTSDFELTLGSTDGGLEAFVDADWALQSHRHSISGYVIMLNGGPVAWSA
jgi:Reverse transcriptase (RNA-dependent DNA polymerase)